MGVKGLWEVLQPAGQSLSLAHLAVVEGFEKNASGRRALRFGVDASLWYQHVSAFTQRVNRDRDIGANPDVACLFFRLANLPELPILPLFVFDGHQRPKVKRGSKMGKSGSHGLTQKMKELLDAFGMEWRMALGEAEAELAYLNHVGIIDAIMTDDGDAFLFGAKTIIKNPSLKLTGNKTSPALNSEGKASQSHVKIFTADAIRSHPEVRLTRGGMILIALLSGGDYDDGVERCGERIAHALALCGFGDQLLQAYERSLAHLHAFLPHWRAELVRELRTNSQGYLRCSYPSLVNPDAFPKLEVLEAYVKPICSGTSEQQDGGALRDRSDPNLTKIAAFCEAHFDEWGHRSAIIKRFRTLLWDSAVMTVLRRAALEADEKEKDSRVALGKRDLKISEPLTPLPRDAVGTPTSLVERYLTRAVATADRYGDIFVNRSAQPEHQRVQTPVHDSHPLLKAIVGIRSHVSTDYLPEYRVAISPRHLVDLACKGIRDIHPEPPAGSQRVTKNPPPEPYEDLRLWLPASMVRQVHPGLIGDYETAEVAKKARGTTGKRGRQRATVTIDEDSEPESRTSQATLSQRH